jgi:ornithine cyclodeaminase
MDRCIEVMDRAMRAVTAGEVATPPRTVTPLQDGSGHFFLMPGAMLEPAVFGAKVVSLLPGNPDRGLPTIQGFVVLFDHQTGAPVALVDGAEITAIRTAAVSGLASRELARADAGSHGIFGAGVLAATHLEAIASVRRIESVVVWARDAGKAERFANEQAARTGMTVTAAAGPEEAAACDVVTLVTGSAEPLLRGQWLREGAHVNLVGAHSPTAREADSDVLERAAIYVDLLASALAESGDILIPLQEERIERQDIVGEIGAVLTGDAPGRSDERQVTLFKSLGVVGQDLFTAEFVYRQALAEGRGMRADLS